jgi:hypothetical protein
MSRERVLWGAAGLGLAALFVFLAALGPAGLPGFELCLFRRLTGISCPACGLTRAAAALGRGDLAGSIAHHPLFLPLALAAATGWLLWGRALFSRRALPRRGFAIAALLAGGALLAAWLVRAAQGTLPR